MRAGWRTAVALASATAVLALGACDDDGGSTTPSSVSSPASSAPASPVSSRSAAPGALLVPSERSYKADLIERLGFAPELVFFGGSRSMRFSPATAERATGLRGFNLAMTNGKPEDAWAFANWLLERSPDTRLHWVWGIQPSSLNERDLDPGLLQDERLERWFPAGLLAAQARLLPTSPDEVPADVVERREYGPDGLLLRNSYDERNEKGRRLERSLEQYIARTVARLEEAQLDPPRRTRTRAYFERTIELLNDRGVTPVIVIMPIHPAVLPVLREHGYGRDEAELKAYLRGLRDEHEFVLADLTRIDSFAGDPDEFYDGVHITERNADRVIAELVRRAPDAFR